MRKTPAKAGWLWIKEALSLFCKQPTEIVTLFLGYIFLTLILNIIPLLGRFIPLLLTPIFGMAFMKACINVEQGKRVYPKLLLTGFQSPSVKKLLILGILHLLAAFVAISASAVINDAIFWNFLTSQATLAFNNKDMQESNVLLAMLFSIVVYTPAAMAFWYAAPLIMWKDMSVSKAIFYSFFGVLREIKAFGVYGIIWAIIGIALPSFVSSIVAGLMGNAVAIIIVLLPISVILTVVMHCSFYTTYIHMFGRPYENLS